MVFRPLPGFFHRFGSTYRTMFVIKAILVVVIGVGGLWFSIRHLRRNIAEIRGKQAGQHRIEDKFLNYPLMFLWFGYLILFFGGLIVNNLVFR